MIKNKIISIKNFIEDAYTLIIDIESNSLNIINIDTVLEYKINILIKHKNFLELLIIFILKIVKLIKIKTFITKIKNKIKFYKYIINSILYIIENNNLNDINKIYQDTENILNYNKRALIAIKKALKSIFCYIGDLLLLGTGEVFSINRPDPDLSPLIEPIESELDEYFWSDYSPLAALESGSSNFINGGSIYSPLSD